MINFTHIFAVISSVNDDIWPRFLYKYSDFLKLKKKKKQIEKRVKFLLMYINKSVYIASEN